MAMSVEVNQQPCTVSLIDILSGSRASGMKSVPSFFGSRIMLGGFGDVAIWVHFRPVKIADDEVGGLAESEFDGKIDF